MSAEFLGPIFPEHVKKNQSSLSYYQYLYTVDTKCTDPCENLSVFDANIKSKILQFFSSSCRQHIHIAKDVLKFRKCLSYVHYASKHCISISVSDDQRKC